METQSRWKSKALWTGVVSCLLMLAGNLGLYETLGITQQHAQAVCDTLLTLLALLGVISNPTSTTGK